MHKNKLALSIVVPIYNASQYLDKCILSILDQGLNENDYEIILINDGSTDCSLSICNRYLNDKPSLIKVINKSNEGVAATRNCGINHAQGKYIYFIDADDYLIPNGLNYLITNYLNDNIDVLSFWSLTIDKKTKRTFIENNDIKGKICIECKGWEFLYTNFQTFVTTSIYKRDFLRGHALSFEKVAMVEDVLFNLQVYLKNPTIRVVSSRLYRYNNLNDGSIIHSRNYTFVRKAIDGYLTLLAFLKKEIDNCVGIDVKLSEGLKRVIDFQLVPFMSRLLSSDLSIDEIRKIKNNLMQDRILPLTNIRRYNRIINYLFRFYYLFPLFQKSYQKFFIPYIFPHLSRN